MLSCDILLIQNDPADVEAIRDSLRDSSGGSFRVEWVKSCSAALERLGTEKQPSTNGGAAGIAAILVDLFLIDSQGIETFERLFCAAPRIPIIVLAAAKDEPLARSAVQHGAHDYLLKTRLGDYLLAKTLHAAVERAANADVLVEGERARATLDSIGDAVLSTDLEGHVTYLNAVAEAMTGWRQAEAAGHPVEEVLQIIDASTRASACNPMVLAMREDRTVALTPNCVLVRRDGIEVGIEDSAAPIHARDGRATGAVIVFRDVSAARELSKRMAYLAHHDDLTGLPNRAVLDDRLAQAIAAAHRRRRKLALLFVDVDRFKHINDSLGHDIGDHTLKLVAQRLVACVRSSDTVSRQGGDEFVILLSEVAHAQDAAISASKMLLALRAPHRIEEHDLHITASIGIATYPEDGTDVEQLKRSADIAMFHAKKRGRNDYQFFRLDTNMRATNRRAAEIDLRGAVQRNEFVLHYQPRVNLQTGAIIGIEALIRWRYPRRGLVYPPQFIAVAEECGLITSIGRWVLREACRQTRAWQTGDGLRPTRIGVNISAAELREKDFVAAVRAILTETGLEAQYLELELTENSLMQDTTTSAEVLRALKGIGVHLALDDFGTGDSSLTRLRRFPIDTLKIDRSFMHDLSENVSNVGILGALISMGRSLQMRVVAEGVETKAQLEFLREQSCPEGQGYYFGRPVAAEKITELLGSRGAAARARVEATKPQAPRQSVGPISQGRGKSTRL